MCFTFSVLVQNCRLLEKPTTAKYSTSAYVVCDIAGIRYARDLPDSAGPTPMKSDELTNLGQANAWMVSGEQKPASSMRVTSSEGIPGEWEMADVCTLIPPDAMMLRRLHSTDMKV